MNLRRSVPSAYLAVVLSALSAAGQVPATAPGGLAISGPSPWIDPTSPAYGAKCDGATDDTAALQNALLAIGPLTLTSNTGTALFIPPTSGGCLVQGYHFPINYATTTSGAGCGTVMGVTTCVATLTLGGSPPTSFAPVGSLINIHNVSNGTHGTIFNGTFVVIANQSAGSPACTPHTGSYCISFYVSPSGTLGDTVSSLTNAEAEIGIYFTGSNLKIIGSAFGSGNVSASATGSMLVTNQPITILTTYTNDNPHTGPDIQNLTFVDLTGTSAYAGLNIGNTNGFNVSNNGFSGFGGTGTLAAADPQGVPLS